MCQRASDPLSLALSLSLDERVIYSQHAKLEKVVDFEDADSSMSQQASRVLELFERAAQSLESANGDKASSSRRLEFGVASSPSLAPLPMPSPYSASVLPVPSSRQSARNVPLLLQPDSRLDHHRAAVLGQRLLVAELRGCERQAALVAELMQLSEALGLQRAEVARLAGSQPDELQVLMRLMQRELQAVELRHHPLREEKASPYLSKRTFGGPSHGSSPQRDALT